MQAAIRNFGKWLSILLKISMLIFGLIFIATQALAAGDYSLHVSSYRSSTNAGQDAASYKAKGFESFYRYEQAGEKGMWYRVYVGRYTSKNVARNHGRALESKGAIGYFTVRYVGGAGARLAGASSSPYRQSEQTQYDDLLNPSQPQPVYPQAPQPVYTQEQQPVTNQEQQPIYFKLPPPSGQQSYSVNPSQDPQVIQPAPTQTAPVYQQPQQQAPQAAPVYQQPQQPQAAPVYQQPQQQPQAAPYPADAYDPYQSTAMTGGPSDQPKTPFYLNSWMGPAYFTNSGSFKVTNSAGHKQRIGSDVGFHFALAPTFHIIKIYSAETAVEKIWGSGFDLWYVSLSGKADFEITKDISAYAKLGGVWGTMYWEQPGGFNSAFGWQVGGGMDYNWRKWIFGFETFYRDIRFEYTRSGSGYSSNSDKIDMSSISFLGTCGYRF